ncbi:MAG: hypothetical protein ACRDVP_07265 [Acidimicrobiales bacterium]
MIIPVDAYPEIHPEAQAYIDRIAPKHRPLFDRLHELIVRTHPDVSVGFSYKMPVYALGANRLHVGVWSHGLSLCGWAQGSETAFTSRHPGLKTSKGAIRLGPKYASTVTDSDSSCWLRPLLAGDPEHRAGSSMQGGFISLRRPAGSISSHYGALRLACRVGLKTVRVDG